MAKVGSWSTTPGSNNSTPPDGWPEGQAPSTVNDCAREMMAQIRTFLNDAQYIDQNLTPTFINTTSFSVAGNQTSAIHAGRRLKIFDATAGVATTIYATVVTASFTTVTTVSISADGGQLTSSLSSFAIAILSNTNDSLPRKLAASYSAVATDTLTINNTTTASGAVSLLTTLSVSGAATLNSTLTVSGAVSLLTTLSVSGAARVNGILTVDNDIRATGNISAAGGILAATYISGGTTLSISGAAVLKSTLNVEGATSLSGAVACGTTLSVSGAAVIKGALSVGGILSIANNIAFPATQVASADANTLDDYEEFSAASTACTGAITTAVSWKAVKIGSQVTLTLPTTEGSASVTASIVYGVSLPADFRPTTGLAFPVLVRDNATNQTTPGMIIVAAAGTITIYKDATAGSNFTSSALAGLAQGLGTSLSWRV